MKPGAQRLATMQGLRARQRCVTNPILIRPEPQHKNEPDPIS
jgi:hypothetical protein